MTGRRGGLVTDGLSRGGSRSPNEINRDPPLSAEHLPAGRRPVFSQIASRVGSRPDTRSIFLRYRSPTGRRLRLSRVHPARLLWKRATSGCCGIILRRSEDSRQDRERDDRSLLLSAGEHFRALVRFVIRSVIGIDMHVRSTRGRWTVLAGFAMVCVANLRLASCEKESENEGKVHSEELRQYTCCARYEKMIDVGYGISGEVIQIDAGHCRKLCPRHVSDDPGDASRPAVQKCASDSHCRARAAKLERVSTLQGVRVIEAIDACECSPESSCRRESYTHHVHFGTPHQAIVDIGVCIGHCGKDLGCKPVRNNTISVKGPNGDEVYQVVEKCGCAGYCHRMDHMETVLDYSEVTIKEGTNTTDVRPVVRQINVGQCVGTCPGNETETCLLRDKKDPSRCVAGLYSKQHTCTPARFKVHEYRTRRGAKRETIQITQCACV